jgi:glycerophosphoryl diester phosphodiesterase
VPLGLAHRGDWSSAPENTIEAFLAAERAGADLIELDVRLSADGEPVVVHDPTFARVWGDPRRVDELPLAEIQALAIGAHGVPTLREVLEATSTGVMVDYTEAHVVAPTLDAIRDADALDRVLFAGGNLDGHAAIRRAEPDAEIALSWETRTLPAPALLEELRPSYFNPQWELLDREVVELMHGRGLRVSCWTVDDEAAMAAVVALGVDAVITNRIGALVALLQESPC